jgi:hypothetical protein
MPKVRRLLKRIYFCFKRIPKQRWKAAKKPWIWWIFSPHSRSFIITRFSINQLSQFKKKQKKCWKWDWSGRRQRIRNKLQHTTWWSLQWFRRKKKDFYFQKSIIKKIKIKWINFSITGCFLLFRASRKPLWQNHRSVTI